MIDEKSCQSRHEQKAGREREREEVLRSGPHSSRLVPIRYDVISYQGDGWPRLGRGC